MIINVDDEIGKRLADLAKKSPGKDAEALVHDAIAAYLAARQDARDRVADRAESNFLFEGRNHAR